MALATIGDIKLYYETHGSGPAIIFAAGLGGFGSYWRLQLKEFACDHTVVLFDHRGVGGSGPAEPPYSISGWGRDVIGLMDALNLGQAIYVGHSAGGAMGQWLCVNHPERFSGMVLSATWRHADARLRALFETRKETLIKLGAKAYMRHSIDWLYPRDWFTENDGNISAIAERMAAVQPSDKVVAGRLDAIIASDHGDGLGSIDMPVLVTYASDDHLIPPGYPRAVAKAIPGARILRFASGGHYFPVTRSRRFNIVLREFFDLVCDDAEPSE